MPRQAGGRVRSRKYLLSGGRAAALGFEGVRTRLVTPCSRVAGRPRQSARRSWEGAAGTEHGATGTTLSAGHRFVGAGAALGAALRRLAGGGVRF